MIARVVLTDKCASASKSAMRSERAGLLAGAVSAGSANSGLTDTALLLSTQLRRAPGDLSLREPGGRELLPMPRNGPHQRDASAKDPGQPCRELAWGHGLAHQHHDCQGIGPGCAEAGHQEPGASAAKRRVVMLL